MFSPWKPLYKIYDKAFILGLQPRHAKAFGLSQTALGGGGSFLEIVWLTGDRPLDSRVDGLTDRCSTELRRLALSGKRSRPPGDLQAVPVSLWHSMKGMERPNTEDTILAARKWPLNLVKPCLFPIGLSAAIKLL